MIETEFGLRFEVNEELTATDIFCISYPYTLDLCKQMQERTGGMKEALSYRNITDPVLIAKLEDTAGKLLREGWPLPMLAKGIADAHYVVAHSFPYDDLYLVDFCNGKSSCFCTFSTARFGQNPQKEIPCPLWLQGDDRISWIRRKPEMVNVALDTQEHSAAICMQDYCTPIRGYLSGDIQRATDKKIKRIYAEHREQKQIRTIRSGHLSRRRGN